MADLPSKDVAVPRWLLEQIQTELRHCHVFVTTRQKMHPTGVEQYEQLQQHVLAYLSMPLTVETPAEPPYTPELHHALWVSSLLPEQASHAAHHSACVVLAAEVQTYRGIYARAEQARKAATQCESRDPDHGTWCCEKPKGHDGPHEVHGETAYVSWPPRPRSSVKTSGEPT